MGTGNGVGFLLASLKRIPVLLDDPMIRRIDGETESDLALQRKRRNAFSETHPKWTAVPGIGPLARWWSSVGLFPTGVLLTVLILFTAIKAPYFGLPFTGEHAMKYSAYVEPVHHMVEKNDITWYQMKYQSDPVHNSMGIFQHFGHLPLYEWGLFAAFQVLPHGSIETKTRIYTHAIGVLILISAFFFFRRWVPTNLTLLLVSLLAVNPIFSFSTFLTVLDSLAILLTFVSLTFLTGYLESGKISRLFVAGVVFGLGSSVKYSMFLWGAPIGFLLLHARRESLAGLCRDVAVYGGLGSLCIIATLTSVSRLPGAPAEGILMTGVWILLFFLLWRLILRYRSRMDSVLEKLVSSRIRLLVAGVFLLGTGILVVSRTSIAGYVRNFLTDSSLLFDPRVYAHMLRTQFKGYLTPAVFWLGAAGFGILFATKGGRVKKVTEAFLAGSVVYWVIASKAMFVHNYYTIIIMITFNLLAATALYYLLLHLSSIRVKAILSLFFLVLIFPRVYEANVNRLGQVRDVSEVNRFILERTEADDLILNESVFAPITIYTGRGLIFPRSIRNQTIREDIRRIGFAETMKKYRIRYLLTPNETPMYIDFAPIFAETEITEPRFDRRHLIYEAIGERNPEMEEGYRELENVVEQYRIPEKFREEARIGTFRFFSFVN